MNEMLDNVYSKNDSENVILGRKNPFFNRPPPNVYLFFWKL